MVSIGIRAGRKSVLSVNTPLPIYKFILGGKRWGKPTASFLEHPLGWKLLISSLSRIYEECERKFEDGVFETRQDETSFTAWPMTLLKGGGTVWKRGQRRSKDGSGGRGAVRRQHEGGSGRQVRADCLGCLVFY